MELKQIKELMVAMERTGMKKLLLKKGGFELQLERPFGAFQETAGSEAVYEESFPLQQKQPHREHLPRGPEGLKGLQTEERKPEQGSFITSPMVGTFYSSPSPEDASFVKVGDYVEKNSVVCIIEAMKVMNEIKAGVSGTIEEILVDSGHPVEFGSKLFRIS